MNYDQWKTMAPEDDLPEEECFHEEYEADWEGRASCDRCGHSWWMTSEQIAADRAHSDSYDAYVRSEMRKEWIASWFRPLAFWRRWRKPRLIDDEVPF